MNIQNAADTLFARRQNATRGERLEPACRPTTLEQALDIQAAISALYAEAGITIAGWKCLMPPEGKVVVAPIYDTLIFEIDNASLLATDGKAPIEPEIAFVFDQDLPAKTEPYTEQEVLAAVKEQRMAFELIGSRYQMPGDCEFPELLADGLFNQGICLGPTISETPSKMTIAIEGGLEQVFDGAHPNEDCRAPLTWLVNFLNSRKLAVQKGQVVITGSFAGVINVPFDQAVAVNYQGIGQCELTLAER